MTYEIKKLEWVEKNGWYYSTSPSTNYRVINDKDGYRAMYTIDFLNGTAPIEVCKAKAQEHFENGLMKFLNVPTTEGDRCTDI